MGRKNEKEQDKGKTQEELEQERTEREEADVPVYPPGDENSDK